jgi:glycosyltransferase involved in cell wall biosynthesis
MAMRIGIDARLNGYREGGITEYTRALIGALATLDRVNDYQVLHAARGTRRGTRRSRELTPGPNFRRVMAFTPCHHRIERFALAGEIVRLRLDVLHSPDFIPPRFGARRKVITIHDLNFLYYPQFQTRDSLRYYNGHIRAAVRQADHILADSLATKNDLVNLLGVPADKVTVHLLGVSPAFKPLPADVVEAGRQRLGLPPTYLLFVGTFEPRKNLPGLLDAYHSLCATLTDAPPLVIAGRRGWLYESIFQKVADLRLAERVKWLEDLPHADLPVVYNGAAALVAPSFYEGFGLTALEAMACGVPTVVSDRGSLPEVVGVSGLLIDPDRPDSLVEALRRVLTDETLRQHSRAAGLARAAMFTWRQTARTVLSVYRRVLN